MHFLCCEMQYAVRHLAKHSSLGILPHLSLETFRRDQIYFTEKNADTGDTDFYSLDEFIVRKTDNIEKGYLLGRYGAIPYPYTEEII